MPAAASHLNVPEFHDCQRFIVKDPDGALRYDSLFAIFAADSLLALDILSAGARVTAAQIYAEGRYDLLGIEPNLNCLIITKDSTHILTGWMIPVSAGVHCDSVPISAGRQLRVEPDVAHLNPSDYPRVARWQWDSVSRSQYIGVYCGRAWCRVTNPALAPPPVSTAGDGDRTQVVEGWYDHQMLAYIDPQGRSVPSLIQGRIYPDPALDTITVFPPAWTPVARVALDTMPGVDHHAITQYKDGMNFDVTAGAAQPGGPLNTIFFCRGNGTQCGVPTVYQVCDGEGEWWSKIEAAGGGSPKYLCVVRRGHGALATPFRMPGTARWRWKATDEGTWQSCLQGCCEVGGT